MVTAPVCPYCEATARLVDSSMTYNARSSIRLGVCLRAFYQQLKKQTPKGVRVEG